MTAGAVAVAASPAYAVPQSRVYVQDGTLHYSYSDGVPATRLVVRTSGTTFSLEDSFGLFAGAGCWHPSEAGWVVHCAGVIDGYRIETGPLDDFVDIYPTGSYATIVGVIHVHEGNDTVIASDGGSKIYGGNGADTLDGQYGNDLCNLGAGGLTRIACER